MKHQFNKDGYKDIIKQARSAGYTFTSFKEALSKKAELRIILRHDVDASLEAAMEMATLESKLEISSTYFFILYNNFYNPLSPYGSSILKKIKELGHEIGLHWYLPDYDGKDLKTAFKRDLDLLSGAAGTEIISVSQHDPTLTGNLSVEKLIDNEAYSAKFKDFVYISDSSMEWRGVTPWELIEKKVSFQFLAHPLTWVMPGLTLEEKFNNSYQANIAVVKKSFKDRVTEVRQALRNRKKLDKKYILPQN